MPIPPNRYQNVARHLQAQAGTTRRRPATETDIREAERRLGVSFPDSYIWFLQTFGFAGWTEYIYGIAEDLPAGLNVVSVTQCERELVEPRLPQPLVPVSPDGAGNHYCLDTRTFVDGECPVVFWSHELDADQHPTQTHPSFLAWLEARIELASEEAA